MLSDSAVSPIPYYMFVFWQVIAFTYITAQSLNLLLYVFDVLVKMGTGREWRQKQVQKISEKVFDCLENESGKANLTFEDLYIAVLLTFNDLNKRLPGPHVDPPTKEKVKALMQECDMNLDEELNREEFEKFITILTAETLITVSQGLIISLAIAPALALLTKRSTEGLPNVGKVVQKIPSSVYASLVTLAVVMFQKSTRKIQ